METTAQAVLSHPTPAAELPPESSRPLIHSALFKLPWWGVSVALHVLAIMLAGLVSMAIELPQNDDGVVMCCDCFLPRPEPPESMPISERGSMGRGPNVTDLCDYEEKLSDELNSLDEFKSVPGIDNSIVDAFGDPDAHSLFDITTTSESEVGGGGNYGQTMENLVGLGGQATAGTGWGWGGGNGLGMGSDTGNGLGAFGSRSGGLRNRLIAKSGCGGVSYLNDRTTYGLEWLALHQERDGHWNTQKFGAFRKTDTAVTSLALLALLGAGNSEKAGEYQGNVRRAVRWLKSQQQSNGLIFDPTDAGNHRGIGYPMAMATLALAEAAGMAEIPETKASAQRAVDYCAAHQSGTGSEKLGWRYAAGQAGDTSVTGWYVMALKSAKMAKLHVPTTALEGARNFLDSVEVQDGTNADAFSYIYREHDEHAESSHRLTAIGTLARIFLGAPKEAQRASVEAFVARGGVPEWSEQKTDLYYWYYGSLVTFQIGGDVWQRWNEGMVRALDGSQISSGDDAGSWPVVGPYSDEWGRVGQTALACMCLEVYYRYEQVK